MSLSQMQPTTASELQLYRVLQRANLLSYYDVFIEQGGDDVQQLCEAGEDEFLEIMRLVGMSSKPLHVRRLQKALQEWVLNPDHFSQPLVDSHAQPGGSPAASAATSARTLATPLGTLASMATSPASTFLPPQGSILALARQLGCGPACTQRTTSSQCAASAQSARAMPAQPPETPQQPSSAQRCGTLGCPSAAAANSSGGATAETTSYPCTAAWLCAHSPKSPSVLSTSSATALGGSMSQLADTGRDAGSGSGGSVQNLSAGLADSDELDLEGSNHSEDSAAAAGGVLSAAQIDAIREAAVAICDTLPQLEPKPLNLKKQVNRDIELLMKSPITTPEQMEELRKYSAIYGRFDSKRRTDKPVSLHEMSVNEAAAQICLLCPVLLSRRDELFPLARMAVRESGYAYSKGHSRAASMAQERQADTTTSAADVQSPEGAAPLKRIKIESDERSLLAATDGSLPLLQPPLFKLEARLAEIEQHLKRLTTQQAELAKRLQAATQCGDSAKAADIQLQLELLSSEQIQLLSEQMELLEQEHRPRASLLHGTKGDHGDERLCVAAPHDVHHIDLIGRNMQHDSTRKAQQHFVQESLFDEGLRIAKQYGMSDLATELEDMKEETCSRRMPEELSKVA